MNRALLLGLLLTGCFNPDDILPLKGALTSADPVTGQKVSLLRESMVDTGLSCSTATPFKETTADENGAFGFEVFRAQAQKLTGFGQFCFRAQTTFRSGSSVFSDVRGLSGEYQLPTFPDWRAEPKLDGGVLAFSPLAPIAAEESFNGDQVVHRATWTAGDGVAWQQADRVLSFVAGGALRQPLRFDAYVLEDFVGTVALEGQATLVDGDAGIGNPFGGDEVTSFEARAGQTVVLRGTRRPLSRGLSCPPLADPCPLTDGSLRLVVLNAARSLTLELPVPTSVSAVVLRGLDTNDGLIAVVRKDADGGQLLPVQHLLESPLWGVRPRRSRDGGVQITGGEDPRFTVIELDGGIVSSVTVSFPGGVGVLSELSLFE